MRRCIEDAPVEGVPEWYVVRRTAPIASTGYPMRSWHRFRLTAVSVTVGLVALVLVLSMDRAHVSARRDMNLKGSRCIPMLRSRFGRCRESRHSRTQSSRRCAARACAYEGITPEQVVDEAIARIKQTLSE
jgi:hypothetical protein